jgi:hypothetical protein
MDANEEVLPVRSDLRRVKRHSKESYETATT